MTKSPRGLSAVNSALPSRPGSNVEPAPNLRLAPLTPAAPPEPPYYEAHAGRSMSVVRFVFTVVSLCLLIPLAYLMRARAWSQRVTARGRRLLGRSGASPGPHGL